MKLIRFGECGAERPGVLLEDGRRVAVPEEVAGDFDERFFASGGLVRLQEWLAGPATGGPSGIGAAGEAVPEEVRWGAPVARPSKIVCAGLNYRSHAEETGAAIPSEPLLFMKAASAWSGPFDTVQRPPGAEKLDWEVELAVVIGRAMRRVPEERALDFVAGYGVMNDFSERAWQKERGGQWSKGKSGDTFAPFGPWLATPDELPAGGPAGIVLRLSVNGELKQDGHTSDLIFPVAHLLSYISHFMTLLPGDVVSTGTPGGVGAGHVPPVFLKDGDIVEAWAQGLGTQRQRVEAVRPA